MSEHLVNKHVQILRYNISVAAYINHMEGPSPELSQSWWAVCYKLNVTIAAKYLAGSLNQDADYVSWLSSSYKGQFHPRLFKFLDQIYGPHTVNRFTSMTTTPLLHYNSRFLDPESMAQTAMVQENPTNVTTFSNKTPQIISDLSSSQQGNSRIT